MSATLGRIVHYVPDEAWSDTDRAEFAAIVTTPSLPDDIAMVVDLTVFVPFASGAMCARKVPFSEERAPGSWHWPERV